MRFLRTMIKALAAAALAAALSGCGDLRKVKDINVSSCGIKYITPTSSRSVEGVLLMGIDNPAMTFTVSDVDGTLQYYGRTLGFFTAGELPVQAHSSQVYELPCTAALAEKVSLLDIMAIGAKRSLEGLKVDVTLHVKLRNGMGTTLKFKDIDVSQYAE